MNTFVAKKASRAVRLLMMALTAVLIFFFINVMLLVSDIQGTARGQLRRSGTRHHAANR